MLYVNQIKGHKILQKYDCSLNGMILVNVSGITVSLILSFHLQTQNQSF